MQELKNTDFDQMDVAESDSKTVQDLNLNDLEKHYKRVHCTLRHRIFVGAVLVVSIVFIVIFLVYFWHLLTPWRWLTESELEHIKNLALSIVVGVTANFASGYFKH